MWSCIGGAPSGDAAELHGVRQVSENSHGRCIMKIGLGIASTAWEGGAERLGPTLGEIAEAAEAAGFDVVSLTDHVWGSQYTGGVEASQIEAYTALGFIAARTRHVRLVAMATAVSYRHAGLLAKVVTTLDVLWAMLGIGAGDYPEEAAGL